MKLGVDCIGVGTGCLILNDKGEVLLMKRSINSKNQAGFWGLSGGTVEMFETFEDATKRETKEELDIDIEIVKLLSLTDHIIEEEGQHWISPTYLAHMVSGVLKNLEPHKCDELRWFSLDEIPEKLTDPAKEAIKAYKLIS